MGSYESQGIHTLSCSKLKMCCGTAVAKACPAKLRAHGAGAEEGLTCGLPLSSSEGLVDHDARVGQGVPLPLRQMREQSVFHTSASPSPPSGHVARQRLAST